MDNGLDKGFQQFLHLMTWIPATITFAILYLLLDIPFLHSVSISILVDVYFNVGIFLIAKQTTDKKEVKTKVG